MTATSVADSSVSASAVITLLNPLPTITSIAPVSVAPGPFTVTLDGSGFVPTSTVRYGGIPLQTTWISAARLIASGTATLLPGGMVAVIVSNGDPGRALSAPIAVTVRVPAPKVSERAAARFLEQVSFGPNPASLARVQQIGFEPYLAEQFAQTPSTYPDFAIPSLIPVQQRFVVNALSGSDQLRQRVAFALGQVFVVSGFKAFTPEMMVPWLRLLSAHAFGSYESLLRAVTLSPTMGHFLDLANNEKANPLMRSAPNENYARELLQLFTIGPDRLHPDGTPELDGFGQPVAAYDETVVANLARALTGWTYPTRPGAAPQTRNPSYFAGSLQPVPSLHDLQQKTLLDGVVLPAGQGPEEDLDAVLDLLVRHRNVAPFLARRLIQSLVTSNPSPAYVARVAAVFVSNHQGIRGDLPSVIAAIVFDPEARRGDTPGASAPTDGHLREPVLFALGLLRNLGASVDDRAMIAGVTAPGGQSLFYPPSVFSYFPLTYDLPGYNLRAPEFQTFTPSTAVYRANLAYYLTCARDAFGITFDLSPFEQFADHPPQLVEAVNRALLFGRMSLDMRQSIESAVAAVSRFTPQVRVEAAVYLVASSSQYQVQQ